MMSSEIATYLTGRYISFRIFPLSFDEYLMFRRKITSVKEPKTELANYVRLGGFPATHLRSFLRMKSTRLSGIYTTPRFFQIL